MTTKTHLTRQEEFIDEVGIQLRDDDPVAPVSQQVWLNTFEGRLKARVGNLVRVYYDSFSTGSAPVLIDGIIDGNKCFNHYMTLTAPQEFIFQNFLDGMPVRLLLENNQTNSYRNVAVTLPASTVMNVGNYWAIKSASNVNKYHVWYDFNGTGANEPIVADSTAVRVIMTAGRKEKSTIQMLEPANSDSGMFDYVKIYNGSNTEYYIWWNVDSFGGNPFSGNSNGIVVNCTTAQTASQLATATALAINNSGYGFSATAVGDTVTIENTLNGNATNTFKGTTAIRPVNMVGTVATLVEGASSNTANEIATLTASALNALADFDATATADTVNVVYTSYGSADAVQNINIPTGFTSITTAQGSGPINISFPEDVKFKSTLLPNVMPPSKYRLYEFVKIGTSLLGTYNDF